MIEHLSTQRIVALHATEAHFFVTVKPPLDESGESYDQLNFMSEDSRYLTECSQVFVFDRTSFGASKIKQDGELVDFVCSVMKPLGIIPDVMIHPVGGVDAQESKI